MITIPILAGLFIWYVIFGVECALNGATIHRGNQWLMPFRELWNDLKGPAPGGLIHAVIMHIAIPAAPTLLWIKFLG